MKIKNRKLYNEALVRFRRNIDADASSNVKQRTVRVGVPIQILGSMIQFIRCILYGKMLFVGCECIKMDELVSVIVPIYNSEKYLEKCLGSIKNQSYNNIEIIIVDSGAIDNSRRIAESVAGEDGRFRIINSEKSGPAYARMAGYDIAVGKYITFVDSDDYLEDDCIEKFVYTAEENESELVVCGFILEDSNGEIIKKVIPTGYEQGKNETWPYRICSTWGRLYRKDLWEKYNVCFWHEDNAIGEDISVSFLTNAVAKNISVINEAKYHYVRHQGSLMGRMTTEGRYLFPYEGIKKIHRRISNLKLENSIDFYYLGLLKLFTSFEYSIYRNAPTIEKKRYKKYVSDFTGGELSKYLNAWKCFNKNLDLPKTMKVAMRFMLLRLCIWRHL